MMRSPLAADTLFHIGPVPVDTAVVTTWALMALLVGGSALVSHRLRIHAGPWQAMLELFVSTVETQIEQTMRVPAAPFMPLVGSLFAFLLCANLCSILPGVEPPTARLETAAALALIVFAATQWYGVRTRGLFRYLAHFAEPNVLLLPLNVLEELTRTFSMAVRLFGNIMSGAFLIGIVLSLAGLLVPIPLMALDILTGSVQAYIFTVLAMVFIGGAIHHDDSKE